jgi:signal transduction histidine kinase
MPPAGRADATIPMRPALSHPAELRALGVSVVPCLVLATGQPATTVPVPAGASWHAACLRLTTQAQPSTPPASLPATTDDLVRHLAHELRAPLLSSTQLIDLVLDGPELGPAERHALQQASRSVHNAAQRLDALRRHLHLAHVPVAPQCVDASALLLSLAAELDAVWPHRGRRLHVAPGLQVHADPDLLRLALRELLDNAFKFSRASAAPEVTLTLHPVPGHVVLALADNGPGFSAAHAGRLFALFERVHLASEFPGLGTGLALVRRVAERHGGWAWADLGTPGRTTFLLALPQGPERHG